MTSEGTSYGQVIVEMISTVTASLVVRAVISKNGLAMLRLSLGAAVSTHSEYTRHYDCCNLLRQRLRPLPLLPATVACLLRSNNEQQ